MEGVQLGRAAWSTEGLGRCRKDPLVGAAIGWAERGAGFWGVNSCWGPALIWGGKGKDEICVSLESDLFVVPGGSVPILLLLKASLQRERFSHRHPEGTPRDFCHRRIQEQSHCLVPWCVQQACLLPGLFSQASFHHRPALSLVVPVAGGDLRDLSCPQGALLGLCLPCSSSWGFSIHLGTSKEPMELSPSQKAGGYMHQQSKPLWVFD